MITRIAPPTSPLSIGQERARIRALRGEHNAAIAARDVAGITGLATDDFVMILGGGISCEGCRLS